ncbi:MAG TPA: helix-turn-helix domain-containing protein [Candidatus Nanoarchaeia archaeon]|nr:helix-turn-helix domain-containing protein [Candidatus Nanoarchaeia archaeon]
MIIQKDFLNKLKDFGLNSYESKLWIALLSRGVSTAGELSDISNVPRSRAYDVLDSLEKKGFIIVKVGKPIKYLAVSPAEVIERVKKKVVQEAEQQDKILSQLKGSDILEELSVLHNQGIKLIDPTDRSGAFRGRDKVHEHLLTLIKGAKKSITLMVSKDGLDRKYDLLINHLRKAAKNGVNIKISIPAGANKDKVSDLSKFVQVKQDKDISTRFCIVDNKELLLFLTDDEKVHKSYDCAVWIDAPYFVEYFSALFESAWKE